MQKAKEYEKIHFYRGASEEVEPSMDTKEPDDLHIEQPDDIEEEIIHVQVVSTPQSWSNASSFWEQRPSDVARDVFVCISSHFMSSD